MKKLKIAVKKTIDIIKKSEKWIIYSVGPLYTIFYYGAFILLTYGITAIPFLKSEKEEILGIVYIGISITIIIPWILLKIKTKNKKIKETLDLLETTNEFIFIISAFAVVLIPNKMEMTQNAIQIFFFPIEIARYWCIAAEKLKNIFLKKETAEEDKETKEIKETVTSSQ